MKSEADAKGAMLRPLGICLLVLASSLPCRGASPSNLLRNTSFETAGSTAAKAYAWESGNPDAHGAFWGNASRESWRSHSGTWEATIKTTWGGTFENFGGWWQEAPAIPGKTYKASAWFWEDNAWEAADVLKLEFITATGSYTRVVTTNLWPVGEVWTQKTIAAIAPADAAWARMVVDVSGAGPGGAIQIDDASLIEYTPEIFIRDRLVDAWEEAVVVPVDLATNWYVPVQVSWRTVDDSALAGEDYVYSTGLVTWATNDGLRKYITVPLIGSAGRTYTERFFIQLENPVDGTITQEQGSVWIMDNTLPSSAGGDASFSVMLSDTFSLYLHDTYGARVARGLVSLPYSAAWRTNAVTARVAIDGAVAAEGAAGTCLWDTAAGSDGEHALSLFWFDAIGGQLTSVVARLWVMNDAPLHAGRLASNETWQAGKVHIVNGMLHIPTGITLTIDPGAIVKFCNGAGLEVETGGILLASDVIFTHIADDTAGGDSNLDGSRSLPEYDQYTISGYGTINLDAACELRYTAQRVAGTLTASTEWPGNRLYIVTNNVRVPNTLTLTIHPGAVIKFNPGTLLTVQAGGRLNAIGSRAQPIVFTSIRDDAYGGDSNGDGGATTPGIGDWGAVLMYGGTGTFAYCRFTYGGGVVCNGYGAAGTVFMWEDGQGSFRNCVIAKSATDGLFSQAGYLENCVIADNNRGLVAHSPLTRAVNCVFVDNGIGALAHFGPITLQNCVVASNTQYGIYRDGTNVITAANTDFFNPGATGGSYGNVEGVAFLNGNVEVDPLFRDAANGDYRLTPGSLLIDAGDGTVAPASDYFGQPRVNDPVVQDTGIPDSNGACPDVGIYEMTDGAASEVDLLPDWVAGPEHVTVGERVVVNWRTVNSGTAAAVGPWRDEISLVSVDEALGNQSVVLGEYMANATLAPGLSQEFSSSYVIPPLRPGNWKFGVRVNTHRDVFEGRNVANNEASALASTAVSLSNMVSGGSGTVPAGGAASFLLTNLFIEGSTIVITAPTGLTFFAGALFTPSQDQYDWQAIAPSNGIYVLTLPAGVSNAYLTVVNPMLLEADFSIQVRATELELFGVGRAMVPNTGDVTMPVWGAGLSDSLAVSLRRGETMLEATEFVLESPMVIWPTFRMNNLATGSYDVVVSDGIHTSALLQCVLVVPQARAPRLEARLQLPNAVRDGRLYTGWINYENRGDADMPAPIFMVSSSTQTPLSDTENLAPTNELIQFMGISPSVPAGVLKAGDRMRIPFYFTPQGRYRIRLGIARTQEDTPYASVEYATWREYGLAMCEAATRLNLRGRAEWRMSVIFRQAVHELRGQPVTAISGRLRHALTHEPLGGYQLEARNELVDTADTTDPDGHFQLEWLPDAGTNYLDGPELYEVATNAVEFTNDQQDVRGLVIYALPRGSIWGTVREAATPCAAGGVQVVATGQSEEESLAVSDAYGHYTISSLLPGTYRVAVISTNHLFAWPLTNVLVTGAADSVEVNFLLEAGAILTGRVVDAATGLGISNAVVVAGDDVGNAYSGATDILGYYAVFGIPTGEYAVAAFHDDYDPGYQTNMAFAASATTNRDFVLDRSAVFYALPAGGVAPLEVTFGFTDLDAAEAVSFAWDFNNDGVTDSTEKTPTNIYETVGQYTVKLRYVTAAGATQTSVYANCVSVREPITPSIKDDVIVIDDASGYQFVSMNADELTLEQIALPPKPLQVGWVVVGTNDYGFCRRIVSMQQQDATYVLQTEDAGLNDLFDRVDISQVIEVTDESLRRAGFIKNNVTGKWTWSGEAGYSITFEHNFRPFIDFQCALDGEDTYVRCAAALDIGVKASQSARARFTIAFKQAKEYPVIKESSVVWVGALPVLITIELPIKVGTEVNLRGAWSFAQNYSVRRVWRAGLEYDHGLKPLLTATHTVDRNDMEAKFAGRTELKAFIGGEMKIWLYCLSNIGASLEGYGRIVADTQSPAVSLRVGYKLAAFANALDLKKFSGKLQVGRLSSEVRHELIIKKWDASESRFSATPSAGNAPLSVSFSDQSLPGYNGIAGWNWSFGDGSSATERNPMHTYQAEGVYEAALQVKGTLITFDKPFKMLITVGAGSDDPPKPPDNSGDEDGDDPVKSHDPNAIAGPYGFGDPDTQRFVLPGQWMPYIVYFENVSNATAAAQEVRVENPLPAELDWSTFEMGEVVFANQTEMGLAGKSSGTMEVPQGGTNHNVRVTCSLNPTNGLATWYLRIVDPHTTDTWPSDPYAGFLLPNDATHRGEGHVAYRVQLRTNALAAAMVSNAAAIYFDFNEPIATDPAWWNSVAGDRPGAVSGESPTNHASIVSTHPVLSWVAAPLAQTYDVFLWPTNEAQPAVPLESGRLSTFCAIPSNTLSVGDSLNWQVVSSNLYGTSNGPVWQFSVRAPVQYTVLAQAGAHGRIEPSGAVIIDEGDSQLFRILPDVYYHVAGITIGSNPIDPATSYYWREAAADGSLAAEFAANLTVYDVPEWWLAEHGLTNFAADAVRDPTGKGMAVYEDWIADTDPTNPASVFPRIGLASALPGRMSLVVNPTSTSRVYMVHWSTNLLASSPLWTLCLPEKTGTGVAVLFTITNDVSRRTYRTGVRRP